jgi:predicted Zn-dependent protease
MSRWIALTGIVLLGIAAVVVSERRKVDIPAGPNALLYLVADTEQELTRMPVSFTRMSDEDEIRAGDNIARGYRSWQEAKNDPESAAIESYVSEVGARLAAHAHRKLPYKFHYIPDRYFINAFALPGGHVFVGGGLIALMDSEDELAAVIGHEIEHVDHYHCAERVQREQALRKIPLGGLVALPMELFEAGYSKDQELEADREGTRMAVQAGYSANGAIRMFETFQRLYDEYRTRAKTPQEELSQVAAQTLEGYFRSHPLPSERIELVRKMIASEGWPIRAERDLAVAFVFWTNKAKDALDGHKYPQAQQLALRSLQMHPGQQKALEVLARAQFAQADFSGAAASYRKILDLDPPRLAAGYSPLYAQALAAADRRTAAAQFEQWRASIKGQEPQALQVQMAGLALLAGDATPARNATAFTDANVAADWAPDWYGTLAWWYYLAGDYSMTLDLLNNAVQQRPGELRFTTERAWAQIEDRKLADALGSLGTTYEATPYPPDRTMARAVAFWQARRPDEALREFDSAVAGQPEWENARWVKALYSPLVVQSIAEMQDERERRSKARVERSP